jgi:hypothetical protein
MFGPRPKPLGVAEVALRLMARRGRGDWAALVVGPGHDVSSVAEELAQEMEVLGDVDVKRIQDAKGALDLATELTHAAEGAEAERPVIITGLEGWTTSEWVHLDQMRSRLARNERTALVVSQATFEEIMRHAPNFSSWLGGSVWTYQPHTTELTEAERARRLEALRAFSNLSDADVIARAEAGTLPGEPEFAEWLVLLDRGDLLER